MEVVDAADEAGSTDYIRKAVAAATEPTTFAIGTEINMVNRLAAEFPQHTIFCLDPVVCPCSTMYRIHPGYLAWVLEELVAGRSPNVIEVDEVTAADARLALERMLALRPKPMPGDPAPASTAHAPAPRSREGVADAVVASGGPVGSAAASDSVAGSTAAAPNVEV